MSGTVVLTPFSFINDEDKFGQTPLVESIQNGNVEAVKALLSYGANPEQELCHISEYTRNLFELPPNGNVSTEKSLEKFLLDCKKNFLKHPENNIKIEALKQIIALLYAPPKPLKLPPPKALPPSLGEIRKNSP